MFRLIRLLLFLKRKSQLDPTEVVHDRRVASKHLHVERVHVIGYIKGFFNHLRNHWVQEFHMTCMVIAYLKNCIVSRNNT